MSSSGKKIEAAREMRAGERGETARSPVTPQIGLKASQTHSPSSISSSMPTAARFDWDEGNRLKCQKHGVSLAEIEHIFRSDPWVYPDKTGNAEIRFYALGVTLARRHVFVVYTLRERAEGKLIRPISARYMHRKEVEIYERTRKA